MVATGAFGASLQGPQSISEIFNTLNAQLLSWMTVNAFGGELRLLGPGSFVTAGSNVYLVTADPGGTTRYVLTTTTAAP